MGRGVRRKFDENHTIFVWRHDLPMHGNWIHVMKMPVNCIFFFCVRIEQLSEPSILQFCTHARVRFRVTDERTSPIIRSWQLEWNGRQIFYQLTICARHSDIWHIHYRISFQWICVFQIVPCFHLLQRYFLAASESIISLQAKSRKKHFWNAILTYLWVCEFKFFVWGTRHDLMRLTETTKECVDALIALRLLVAVVFGTEDRNIIICYVTATIFAFCYARLRASDTTN